MKHTMKDVNEELEGHDAPTPSERVEWANCSLHGDYAPDDGCQKCAERVFNENEWRMIHNALSIYQSGFRHKSDRKKVQLLMDKVRDNHISKFAGNASKGSHAPDK